MKIRITIRTKQRKTTACKSAKPTFEPFADPNGIPYEEYQKLQNQNESNSKFEPFANPNGVPSTKSQEIPHGYSRAKVVKTYIQNRYNNQDEMEK